MSVVHVSCLIGWDYIMFIVMFRCTQLIVDMFEPVFRLYYDQGSP